MQIYDFISSHHLISIFLGAVSALFWLLAAFASSKTAPNRVKITFGNSEKSVDLHNFILTAKKQARFNGIAALFAAGCALAQIFGF